MEVHNNFFHHFFKKLAIRKDQRKFNTQKISSNEKVSMLRNSGKIVAKF